MILGVDPGNEQTAFAWVNEDFSVIESDKVDNKDFRAMLTLGRFHRPEVVIESIQSYGMAVGRTVFETCYEIGRLVEICETTGLAYRLYPRPEYSKAVCGVMKVNDAVLRRALITRFGGDKKGEPIHLLKGNSDKRSAYAVAVYHLDLLNLRAKII